MLQPKKTKFRKMHKMPPKGNTKRGDQLAFGSFGLKAVQGAWVTDRQIEAARVALTRHMQRKGQAWIRIFPDKPITRKPAEVRMGKGKGAPEFWSAVVKPGRILFEVEGVMLISYYYLSNLNIAIKINGITLFQFHHRFF